MRAASPADADVTLKASVPGPYTLSGRLIPNERYPDRWALTEALLPIVRAELEALVAAGCREISVDEPSMSCYAHQEDPKRFVDIFNRTVAPIVGKTPALHPPVLRQLQGAAGRPPASTRRCSRRFSTSRATNARRNGQPRVRRDRVHRRSGGAMDVAVGVIDVKSYTSRRRGRRRRVRLCLRHAPAERLVFAPDCGLSQTARWAASQKLVNMVAGVQTGRARARPRIDRCRRPFRKTRRCSPTSRQRSRAALRDSGGWGRADSCCRSAGVRLLFDPYLSDSLTRKYAAH